MEARALGSFHVSVIVAAAGSGRRMGALVPKQYLYLLGQPILVHTLVSLKSCWIVDEIIVVVSQAELEMCRRDIIERHNFCPPCRVVAGGSERQESVAKGIEALSGRNEIVLVHDGVRPFVTCEEIIAVSQAAKEHGAATLAVTPNETIKSVDEHGNVIETFERSQLRRIQTPQAFRYSLLKQAHEKAALDRYTGPDDCCLVERMGHKVVVVEGSHENIKITTVEDLELARILLVHRTGWRDREML